jgi:inosine/xanthosine triphosphate pyrophosphatase family protein
MIGVRFIVTDDSALGLSCLNGFPGVYIKAMLEAMGDVGIGDLVSRHTGACTTITTL